MDIACVMHHRSCDRIKDQIVPHACKLEIPLEFLGGINRLGAGTQDFDYQNGVDNEDGPARPLFASINQCTRLINGRLVDPHAHAVADSVIGRAGQGILQRTDNGHLRFDMLDALGVH